MHLFVLKAYMNCSSEICCLLIKRSTNPYVVTLYDSSGDLKVSKQIPRLPNAVLVYDTKNDVNNEMNVTLFMSFDRIFASYEMIIKEDSNTKTTSIESIQRNSIFRVSDCF